MIRRSTWIVVGIFIVLLAAALLWQRRQSDEQAQATPTPGAEQVFDFSADDIQRLSIQGAGGSLILVKDADNWALEEPAQGPADPAQVERLLEQVASLEALSSLQPAPPVEATRLDAPTVSVAILTAGGEHRLEIGRQTPTGSGYYVQAEGKAVYIVSQFSVDSLTGALANPPLAAPPMLQETPVGTVSP